MKRLFILIFLFYGCSLTSPLKKGRVISLYHLIEIGKYEDAKELADEMTAGDESLQWANAWYARGYLCQTAYREGLKNNDAKLYELYPDQLYVALESYEKARTIDGGHRMERQLAPKYVLLANDFQDLGVQQFEKEEYELSLRAFEHALRIEQMNFLSLEQDTLLTYNTALAAYESRNWEKAIQYFGKLHSYQYSENATHLLFRAQLKAGDSAAAEKVLFDGIGYYEDNGKLVFLLTEFLFNRGRHDDALKVVDEAIARNPESTKYYYNKGLIFQKTGRYNEAIQTYLKALETDEDNLMIFANLAACYYNIGVAFEENILRLTRNQAVKKERAKSKKAFRMALQWLDKAIALQPNDAEVVSRLSQLYLAMGKTDKTKMLMIYNE